MSSLDTPGSSEGPSTSPLSLEDLARVENALENINLKKLKPTSASSVPPAVFAASGPMSAYSFPAISQSTMRSLLYQAQAIRSIYCHQPHSITGSYTPEVSGWYR
jgi:hypothetical protein